MDAAKPNSSIKMNDTTSSITGPDAAASEARYQIYRQNRAGVFLPAYQTDSAPEAVEAFLNQAPTFDGGGMRLVELRTDRTVATVEWGTEKTDFGFPVRHRVNRFHDAIIERLAADVLARESLRESVRHSLLAEV